MYIYICVYKERKKERDGEGGNILLNDALNTLLSFSATHLFPHYIQVIGSCYICLSFWYILHNYFAQKNRRQHKHCISTSTIGKSTVLKR